MTPQLLYIIGVPGSGKTTLVRELVKGRRRRVHRTPFVHTWYEDGLVQLGRDRGTFGGTDVLSMSVQAKVTAALAARVWPRVLAEGDRLANPTFFDVARHAGYEVTVALLAIPDEVVEARRSMRDAHVGGSQDERWLRGRNTKVENLRPYVTMELDATKTPAELAAELANHPVLTTRGEV